MKIITQGEDQQNGQPKESCHHLTIAVTKAVLVILFFMHVRHSSHLTKLVSEQAMRKAIQSSVPARFASINLRAFVIGFELGLNA